VRLFTKLKEQPHPVFIFDFISPITGALKLVAILIGWILAIDAVDLSLLRNENIKIHSIMLNKDFIFI
jgi:hypothetical protein